MDQAIDRNRRFAAADGHAGATVMPNLRLMIIGCLDPRVEPAAVFGLELGDAMVLRNAGGRVTPAVVEDVSFIGMMAEGFAPEGPLFEVAVVHHTQCGTAALADPGLRGRYAELIDADADALTDRAVTDPEATVREDVGRLRAAAGISSRITVSGHVYDVVTGTVRTVVEGVPAEA